MTNFLIEHRGAVAIAAGAWVSFKAIALTAAVVTAIGNLGRALTALTKIIIATGGAFLLPVATIAALVAGFTSLIALVNTFNERFGDSESQRATDLILEGLGGVERKLGDDIPKAAKDASDSIAGLEAALGDESFFRGFERNLGNSLESISGFATNSFRQMADDLKKSLTDAFLGGTRDGLKDLGTLVPDEYAKVVADAGREGAMQTAVALREAIRNVNIGNVGAFGPNFATGPSAPSLAGALSGAPYNPALVDLGPGAMADPSRTEQELRAAGRDLVEGVRNGIREGIRAGSLRGLADAIGQSLLDGFAQRSADRIADAVQGLVDILLDSLFKRAQSGGAAGGGFSFAGIGDFFSSAFSSIRGFLGFQGGGIIPGPSGQPRIIGAHAGELVLNEAQQRSLAGRLGGGVTVNVNNTSGAEIGVESSVQPNGEQVIDFAVSGSLDRQVGSGSADRFFQRYGAQRNLIRRL